MSINNFEVALGRNFDSEEDEGRRRVAVVGSEVAASL